MEREKNEKEEKKMTCVSYVKKVKIDKTQSRNHFIAVFLLRNSFDIQKVIILGRVHVYHSIKGSLMTQVD